MQAKNNMQAENTKFSKPIIPFVTKGCPRSNPKVCPTGNIKFRLCLNIVSTTNDKPNSESIPDYNT